MKLKIPFDYPITVRTLLQRCGYHAHFGFGELESYVRRVSRDSYPRFHVYVEEDEQENQLSINLHLDQKKPSYAGAHAHSGEYDGERVETELKRIQSQLLQLRARTSAQETKSNPASIFHRFFGY